MGLGYYVSNMRVYSPLQKFSEHSHIESVNVRSNNLPPAWPTGHAGGRLLL